MIAIPTPYNSTTTSTGTDAYYDTSPTDYTRGADDCITITHTNSDVKEKIEEEELVKPKHILDYRFLKHFHEIVANHRLFKRSTKSFQFMLKNRFGKSRRRGWTAKNFRRYSHS